MKQLETRGEIQFESLVHDEGRNKTVHRDIRTSGLKQANLFHTCHPSPNPIVIAAAVTDV